MRSVVLTRLAAPMKDELARAKRPSAKTSVNVPQSIDNSPVVFRSIPIDASFGTKGEIAVMDSSANPSVAQIRRTRLAAQ